MASRKKIEQGEEKRSKTDIESSVSDKSKEPQKEVKKSAKATAKEGPFAEKENQLLPMAVEKKERKSEKQAPSSKKLPTVAANGDVTASTIPISFPELEKRSFWSRVLVILVMLAVLIASVVIFMFRPSEYTERTDSVNFLYLPDNNRTIIAVNGTVRGEVDGALRYKTYDGTGRVCAALIEDRLYLIKGRKVVEIAATVSDCVLSSNGQALAWRNSANELFYMIVGKKDSTYRISNATTDARYCLSPDGKELAYTYLRDDVLRMDVYSCTGSKPYFSENEGCYPLGVSDKCRYLYYTNGDGALYALVQKTGKSVLCGNEPNLGQLIFNRDNTELLFCNGTETRLFVNGERLLLPTLLSTDSLELLPNRRVAIRDTVAGKQYLMETLCDNYYLHYRGTGKMLVFLERKKDQGVLLDVYAVDGKESITVTDKSVFFLSTSQGTATHTNLYCCKTGETEVEDLCWDVGRFCTNVDGSRILFTDVQGALLAYRLEAFPERLCDAVIEDSITVTADDAFYFYCEEGSLWVSDNADQPRLVREGIGGMLVDGKTAYYVTDIAEDGCGTVYSNYRNMRKDTKVAERVGAIQ